MRAFIRQPTISGCVLAGAAATLIAAWTIGCSSRKEPPQSVQQLHAALERAVQRNRPARVYELLDLQSQWSVQSALKAQLQIRRLVRDNYPRDRQARELQRTKLAAGVSKPEEYFVRLARAQNLLVPFAALSSIDRREGSGEQLTLVSGKVRLRCCREDKRWAFCGLREQLERYKLRVVRDLETVREGVEMQEGGG